MLWLADFLLFGLLVVVLVLDSGMHGGPCHYKRTPAMSVAPSQRCRNHSPPTAPLPPQTGGHQMSEAAH